MSYQPDPEERVDKDEALLAENLGRLSRRMRKRKLVLYFGRQHFSDNTKYVFLRDLERPRDYDVMWCSFNPEIHDQLTTAGLPSLDVYADVDRAIDLFLHAAVSVFCENPNSSLQHSRPLVSCLAGGEQIQLWHGISVKRLLLQLSEHLPVRGHSMARALELGSRATYVSSSAPMFDEYWSDVFGCRQIVRAGLPRNEVLLRPATGAELLGAALPPALDAALNRARSQRRPCILVTPTWQRTKTTFLMEDQFIHRTMQFAERTDSVVVMKMHAAYNGLAPTAQMSSRVFMLDSGTDVYPHMPRFDLLVTDYSSIMFDFLLTDRPVLRLALGPNEHQPYEPDFSLVPNVQFASTFTAGDYEDQLVRALTQDPARDGRREMTRRIFDTDPLDATNAVLRLVDRLVEASTRDQLLVV